MNIKKSAKRIEWIELDKNNLPKLEDSDYGYIGIQLDPESSNYKEKRYGSWFDIVDDEINLVYSYHYFKCTHYIPVNSLPHPLIE